MCARKYDTKKLKAENWKNILTSWVEEKYIETHLNCFESLFFLHFFFKTVSISLKLFDKSEDWKQSSLMQGDASRV